jgi:drug/metabolite transporter (DMT)-like permease
VESKQVKKRLLDGCLWLRRQRPQRLLLDNNNPRRRINMLDPPGDTVVIVTTQLLAAVYVLSGVSQPLLMTICKDAGLADPVAQLFMVFYYLGPCVFAFVTINGCSGNGGDGQENSSENRQLHQQQHRQPWPSLSTRVKASGIALFDIAAQALNYTGASLAGPTIFSIVYASVTVWTAVWARLVLGRRHSYWQWLSFALVFGGLCLTGAATRTNQGDDAAEALAPSVLHGTLLVLFGSVMHAGSYVLSEAIMTGPDRLSVAQNTTLQSMVACILLVAWQFIYTIPRWSDLIDTPMKAAGTSWTRALCIMMTFAFANLLHSYSFYYTIKNYKGGSVMAGVMKGLQAVLVFVVTHFLFCGKTGGSEMCFSQDKLLSLITVVGGVCLFAASTSNDKTTPSSSSLEVPVPQRDGYTRVEERRNEAIQTV